MSKYKFTYFLNTACAERRPQTRRDLIEDWKEEEKEYPTALEAFEHAYIEILDNDEEDLQDLYEENGIGLNDEVKKLEALKNDFDCIDPGDGSTILISIEGEGPVDSYDSGFTKESFNDDYIEDDEDYDDEEYLDENKNLNEDEQLEIDEKGLPVLERPYDIRERNDSRFQITSYHPYDMTEYSYAISKNNDINSDWEVYDPENPRTIVSDYSARKTTLEGTYKGWNEALEAMKRIDSNKTRRIDRT